MKPISKNSIESFKAACAEKWRRRDPDNKMTEEERILDLLKAEGFTPMTPENRKRLAKANCLGMPEE